MSLKITLNVGLRNSRFRLSSGFLFSLHSCFCKFPQCLSAHTNLSVLCCRMEATACRPTCCVDETAPVAEPEELCCVLLRGQAVLERPQTICKGMSQCFCCDNRFALPCDEEVPCLLFLLPFCTVCVNGRVGVHCCHSVRQLLAVSAGGGR